MDFDILGILADWSGVFVVAMGIVVIVFMFLIKNRIVDTLSGARSMMDENFAAKSEILRRALDVASELYFSKGVQGGSDKDEDIMDVYNSILSACDNAALATRFVSLVKQAKGGNLSAKTYEAFVSDVRRELGLRGSLRGKEIITLSNLVTAEGAPKAPLANSTSAKREVKVVGDDEPMQAKPSREVISFEVDDVQMPSASPRPNVPAGNPAPNRPAPITPMQSNGGDGDDDDLFSPPSRPKPI